jgi:hypothetical protein
MIDLQHTREMEDLQIKQLFEQISCAKDKFYKHKERGGGLIVFSLLSTQVISQLWHGQQLGITTSLSYILCLIRRRERVYLGEVCQSDSSRANEGDI